MGCSKIFYFDDSVKQNVKNILPFAPTNYISIHLRLGDKFLETHETDIEHWRDYRYYDEKKTI